MSSAKRVLLFVTGNAAKAREIEEIISVAVGDLTVERCNVDLPELQGEPKEIAREKCRIAAEKVNAPLIVEDTSLCFNALGGLPGPYIKWFKEKIGNEGLFKMLKGFEDHSAYAQTCIAFSQGKGHEPVVISGTCNGTIVFPRGTNDFGWDPIFQPEGSSLTFAEMEKTEKNKISHRYNALKAFQQFLTENPGVLSGADADNKRQKTSTS